jgi:tRNA(Ile)-lysidine synthase
MSLLRNFKGFIKDNDLFSTNDSLILAVSGGIDSIVLCELCSQAGYRFSIAHCNFQLRGAESERDAQFVQSIAVRYKAPFHIQRFETAAYAAENKLSIQVAARELRYQWFAQLLDQVKDNHNGKWVLTAHHRDDSIETSLMNFFKGTGVTGLRGMLPKKDKLVRPLLFAAKKELIGFATQHGLSFEEDSSNAETKYTRNYFRNEVIPLVSKIYPEAEANLASNLARFRDMEILYQQAIAWHKERLIEVKGREVHIPVLKLKKSMPLNTIVYELIRDYGFTPQQVPEVVGLLDSESGKYVQSPSHRVIRNRKWLIIAPVVTALAATILIEEEGAVNFAHGTIIIKKMEVLAGALAILPDTIACLDAALIRFPLLLRPARQGDYFYPLGMKRKKKIARFLIDLKVSKTGKEKVWVLEMDKKILWVVGRRIDDRFRIGPATKNMLRIELKSIE